MPNDTNIPKSSEEAELLNHLKNVNDLAEQIQVLALGIKLELLSANKLRCQLNQEEEV